MSNLNFVYAPPVSVDSLEPRSRYVPAQVVMKPAVMPRILLVDDDVLYGKIMSRVASCFKAELTFVRSVEELGDRDLSSFDVAIIDYDLGSVTGVELTAYLDHHAPLPIVLVSATERRPDRRWSDSIHDFLLKDSGPFAALDAAFEAHEISRIHEQIRRRSPGPRLVQ